MYDESDARAYTHSKAASAALKKKTEKKTEGAGGGKEEEDVEKRQSKPATAQAELDAKFSANLAELNAYREQHG
jgi:hypothetical protein